MLDILIKNGLVADGTGRPAFRSDIAVRSGKIARIAPVISLEAKRVIDAGGLVVAPGFIDFHSHGDVYAAFGSDGYNSLEQGVTTEITGHCGNSAVPSLPGQYEELKAFLPAEFVDEASKALEAFNVFGKWMEQMKLGTNMALFVGHGSVRGCVMGYSGTRPTKKQMEQMKALISQAMEFGCLGMSTGLIYPPSVYGDQEELTELCKVVARYGGTYTSHIRGEGDTVVEAVTEAIEIGENSGCDVVISHHKVCGKHNEGKSEITLNMIEEANARGKIVVRADQYPFLAGQSSLVAALPPVFATEGLESLVKRLSDPVFRAEVTDELRKSSVNSLIKESGFDGALVLTAPAEPELVGKTIAEIALLRGMDAYETMYDILVKNNAAPSMAYFHICESDMLRILAKPYVMVGADAGHNVERFPRDTRCGAHPRAMSTFPKHLRLVREHKLFPLEQAIEKITAMPARAAHLDGVGLLLEGYHADICVFDWKTIGEANDFIYPYAKNKGISHVVVNGVIAVENGDYNGARAGRLLKVR